MLMCLLKWVNDLPDHVNVFVLASLVLKGVCTFVKKVQIRGRFIDLLTIESWLLGQCKNWIEDRLGWNRVFCLLCLFFHYYQYASPWLCPYVSCVCTQLMASLEPSRLPKGVKIFVAQFLSYHMTTMIVTCMYQVVMTLKKWAWSRWRSGQIPPPFKMAAGIVVSIDVKSNLANLEHFTQCGKTGLPKIFREIDELSHHGITKIIIFDIGWNWRCARGTSYIHPITKFWFMTLYCSQ